jgi:hypothetical protein
LTWTFHNPNASPVSFGWQVLEDNAQKGPSARQSSPLSPRPHRPRPPRRLRPRQKPRRRLRLRAERHSRAPSPPLLPLCLHPPQPPGPPGEAVTSRSCSCCWPWCLAPSSSAALPSR